MVRTATLWSLLELKDQQKTLDTLETLSNYDDDDNDNAKKKLVLWAKQQLCTSRFLVHFLDVHYTITTWNLPMRRFMEDVDTRRQILLLYLNMDKTLKNSTPRKVAYIWRIKRFQINTIKFARTQIRFFFSDLFTAVVCLRPLLHFSNKIIHPTQKQPDLYLLLHEVNSTLKFSNYRILTARPRFDVPVSFTVMLYFCQQGSGSEVKMVSISLLFSHGIKMLKTSESKLQVVFCFSHGE